jgi:hypothetical protein
MHANFVFTNEVIHVYGTLAHSYKKCARVQTAVKWLQRACLQLPRQVSCSTCWATIAELQTAAEEQLQVALLAGPLVKLQTAADPGTAWFCKRLSQLGH